MEGNKLTSKKFFFLLFFLLSLNVFKIIWANDIFIYPSKMNLIIPAGFLDVKYITVKNKIDKKVFIKINYDTTWMFIKPNSFFLHPNETKKILSIFFISKNENPERNGQIYFKNRNDKIMYTLNVSVHPPPPTKQAKTEDKKSDVKKPSHKFNEKVTDLFSQNVEYLNNLKKDFYQIYQKEINNNEIEIFPSTNQIMIRIAGNIAFNLGEYIPKNEAYDILKKFALFSKEKLNDSWEIVIRGHSDDLPIKEEYRNKIPSNWELSALRSASVARFLYNFFKEKNIKISCSAFSYLEPIVITSNLKEKQKNRRIEIIIKPKG